MTMVRVIRRCVFLYLLNYSISKKEASIDDLNMSILVLNMNRKLAEEVCVRWVEAFDPACV